MTVELNRINARIEQAKKALEKFNAEVLVDPAYAFAWADSTFMNAARVQIYSEIKYSLENDVSCEKVKQNFVDFIMREAMSINSKSTSQCANIMKECKIAVASEAIEMFL
ncbi:MAG: hypothetical protein KGI54_14870 [Pseudomonadota bacterium]|nr:hypothetical protein [Pseudomonadota bacterium]